MARSNSKREKRQLTTEEFVQRVTQKEGKHNGLKRHFVWQKRRH